MSVIRFENVSVQFNQNLLFENLLQSLLYTTQGYIPYYVMKVSLGWTLDK